MLNLAGGHSIGLEFTSFANIHQVKLDLFLLEDMISLPIHSENFILFPTIKVYSMEKIIFLHLYIPIIYQTIKRCSTSYQNAEKI